jgi:hypothetical protein
MLAAAATFLLAACGAASPTPAPSPVSAPAPVSSPAPVSAPATVSAHALAPAPPPSEEPPAPGLIVNLEDAPDALPATYLRMGDEVILSLRLGERLVRARVDAFGLANEQSGNGAIFDIQFATLAGGVVVITHHNLDTIVDPPRFAASRWSEGWWLPADLLAGEPATPLGPLGEQYAHAAGQPDGSVCISDALGDVQRLEVQGRALVRMEHSEPCVRYVAEQPEQVFDRVGGRWRVEGDDYLGIHHAEPLTGSMEVLEVAWVDGGQYDDPADAPEHRSTRLVSPDADPEGRVHWYYLDASAYCRPRRRGTTLTCGRRRFRLADDGLIAIE